MDRRTYRIFRVSWQMPVPAITMFTLKRFQFFCSPQQNKKGSCQIAQHYRTKKVTDITQIYRESKWASNQKRRSKGYVPQRESNMQCINAYIYKYVCECVCMQRERERVQYLCGADYQALGRPCSTITLTQQFLIFSS